MLLSEAKDLLSRAAGCGRLAHAYLIVGNPAGDAARLAVHIAQKLSCKEPDAPCGTCEVCRQIAERTWCDVLWVHPMKKSRIISIDQMRDKPNNEIDPPYMLPWLSETSFAGGWKTAIIAEADRMNESAANAFLKMLEEPPPQTLILLLTDAPQQLLPTIRSRCQRIDIAEPQAELPEPYRAQVLAALAGMRTGGPLAATALATKLIAILDDLKALAEGEVKKEVAAESDEIDLEKAAIEARVSARYIGFRSLFMQALQRWFRDMLVLRAGGDEASLNYPEYADTLRVRANAITLSQALSNIGFVEDMARQVERFLPETAVFAYWLDRMAPGVS
jgi:DNA polymerase-3 subunit delta'